MNSQSTVVILAAGDGSRMQSALPKPLHPVGNLPILGHLLATAREIAPERISVVCAPSATAVHDFIGATEPAARVRIQAQPGGTGDALLAAQEDLDSGEVFVLYGDTPLTRADTLREMSAARAQSKAAAAFLAFTADDPGQYGRIALQDGDTIAEIVEARDAPNGTAPFLCNGGVVCADAARLRQAAAGTPVDRGNSEHGLTAAVPVLRAAGQHCLAFRGDAEEALGANNRAELAAVEAAFQARARARAIANGVTLRDPATTWFSHDTVLEADVTVEPSVVFGPGVLIRAGVLVRSFCVLEGCEIESGVSIGPFARVRPQSRIRRGARIGNFAEVKGSSIGEDSRVPHVALVLDADVGARVNVSGGACIFNYDGIRKVRSTIEDDAFVGGQVTMISPVTVGEGAYLAGGSVITEDVPAGGLGIGRARQANIPGWVERWKAKHQR